MASVKHSRRFVLPTWEGGGTVGPTLTVARKLAEAGHDVRLMGDECCRADAAAVGVDFVPWTRAPSRIDRRRESELFCDWEAASPAEGIGRALTAIAAGPALAYAQDLIDELQRKSADLVVSSDFLLGVMAACEAIGQDLVLLPTNTVLFPIDGAPRSGPGAHSPKTPEQQAQEREFVTMFRALFDQGLPALNAARAALGLAPLNALVDQFKVAHKSLIAISRTFDFGPEVDPQGFTYIGPQLDDLAWVEPWQSPWSADDDRPLVLVGFSTTFQNHVGILQRMIDALSVLPVRALVTLGPTIAPAELSACDNVWLVASAPHNEVMKQASLVVTHGGHGTVARAIVHKLPMLVVPHGRDQDGNAARIVAHGAGLMLPPAATTEEILRGVSSLLDDPAYRDAAERLGDAVEREMRDCDVVAELEALCPAVPA